MYSSVSSLHIALDGRLQQLNSNRKQAIMPEQYDVALNDAINIVLKQRLSAKLNSKREGYEDSVAAYDLVKSLKRTCRPTCYLDSIENKWGFELPSNYFMFDTLQANINYDRTTISNTANIISVNKYMSVMTFARDYTFDKDNITFCGVKLEVDKAYYVKFLDDSDGIFIKYDLVIFKNISSANSTMILNFRFTQLLLSFFVTI